MHPFFQALYDRFHKLHDDIRDQLGGLPEEAMDWVPNEEMNSLGVLVTHITGSERFLVGDIAMQDPSNRDREAEFKARGKSKADLLQRLADTEAYLKSAFEQLSLDDLDKPRTHPRQGEVSVSWALLHALEHAGLHTGHIEMTVQLWHLPDGND